jgi:hypothetical protein
MTYEREGRTSSRIISLGAVQNLPRGESAVRARDMVETRPTVMLYLCSDK